MGNISLARGNSDEAKRKYQYALERDLSLREQIEPLLAYAVTMPKAASKSGGPTLAELQQVLTKTGGEDLGELRALAQSLAKPMDWMNSRYRAASDKTRSISERLFALHQEKRLDPCPRCVVFAACWFAERAGPDHWSLLEDAIRKTGDGVLRMTLAYQLARSLERAGERQRAMTAYLTLLPDPRAKARLARLY